MTGALVRWSPPVMPSPRRARRMVQRSMLVYKHTWMVVLTGFFEPVFYLLGIGLGLGSMMPAINGTSYAAFVMPGLLAASCLNGAISDAAFNIFFKLHFQKTYDGILATPMAVADIALGEMLWAVTRSTIYAIGFLAVSSALGAVLNQPLLAAPWATAALAAAIFVSVAFAAMALCVTSFLRTVQDFDPFMGLLVTPMFLFSGIFFPIAEFPVALQWLVAALPLYHAVELLRPLTGGHPSPGMLGHAAYLAVAGLVAFLVAMRRFERTLVK
jgi:lipooligosaccharide transport system permease protein